MKKTDFVNEIKALSVDELQVKAKEIAEELMKLRFRKAAGQLEQTHLLGQLKKNLARVQTVLASKLQEQVSAAAA